MQVTVNTTQFEMAHGKKPRGGSEFSQWAFFMGSSASAGETVKDAVWFKGTFAQAKKQAVAHAKANGFHTVRVGS